MTYDLKYTGFIQHNDEFVDTRTGELLSMAELEYRLSYLQGVSDDYGELHREVYINVPWEIEPVPQELKHRNNLEFTGKLLDINKRLLKTLTRVYNESSTIGLLKEDRSLAKSLGKDWRRLLSGLEKKGWIKKVTMAPNYEDYEAGVFWMLNPEFAIVRDNWTIQRQAWLRRMYDTGVLINYEPIVSRNSKRVRLVISNSIIDQLIDDTEIELEFEIEEEAA